MNLYYRNKLVVIFIIYLISFKGHAQKNYRLVIKFSASFNVSNIETYMDNGLKRVKLMSSDIKDHTLVLSGKYYGTFAIAEINYINEKGIGWIQRFFISSKPASISFQETKIENLDSFNTVNALDIGKAGQNKLYSYAAKEMNDLDSFILQNHRQISNDSLLNIFDKKSDSVMKKKLAFINNNGTLFYSLWLFKTNFVSDRDYDTDSLKRIFFRVFPQKLRNSYEGRTIRIILNGRINTHKSHAAPDFNSLDIYGKPVSLRTYRGKYILLNFWASWCMPCIGKFPALEEIRKSISKSKLEMIMVTYDEDSTEFIKAVEKYKLNYTMISRDQRLINSYGNKSTIPQLYLIDSYGNIIYSLEDEKDADLKVLKKILAERIK